MKKISSVFCLLSFVLAANAQIKITSLQISPEDAVDLISNFITTPGLDSIARKYAIGGVLDPAMMKSAGFTGILFWYCMPPNGSVLPKFFLSGQVFSNYHNYDASEIPGPGASSLFRPMNTFVYNGTGTDATAVKAFLTSQIDLGHACVAIPSAAVGSHKEAFKTYAIAGQHAKYPYAFFDYTENTVMKALLKDNPVAVRYFFGYEPATDKSGVSKIRVILMAVDPDGHNHMGDTKNATPAIVQSSWPPPPWN